MASYTRCPATGKRRYTSPHLAKRCSRGVSNSIRAYRCPDCGGYHVTSRGF